MRSIRNRSEGLQGELPVPLIDGKDRNAFDVAGRWTPGKSPTILAELCPKRRPRRQLPNRAPVAARSTGSLRARNRVLTTANDHISTAFEDFVSVWARGTDQFLDIVQWNIEWFEAAKSAAKDRKRHAIVIEILKTLNADLFIFQEVAGPTRSGKPGVLDSVADALTESGNGDYRVEYTLAGGEQRVAMMWDRDFLRAKGEVEDLFPRGTHTVEGKDAFAQRTPLYGHFEVRTLERDRRFDFQALEVHLKAMGDGHVQRRHSAAVPSDWIVTDARQTDSDILIVGDFNAPPSEAASWQPFHDLEDNDDRVKFRSINNGSEFSY